LNKKYTGDVKGLEKYEKEFLFDGGNYLSIAKKISGENLEKLTNKELLKIFLKHQEKRNKYSVFAWSAYILNNYVAERAIAILDPYIKKHSLEAKRQEIIDALFKPEKLAAILQLQDEVDKAGELSAEEFNSLYERFKWLSCLDIQNKPWTKEEFKEHIKSFAPSEKKEKMSFEEILQILQPSNKDLEYLHMAKKFVYIKDARDDFRRESVFYSASLWRELGKRIGVESGDMSYLQDEEIVNFLNDKGKISKEKIDQRKKGFMMYLSEDMKLICLSGGEISGALRLFKLLAGVEKLTEVMGRVASKGMAKGIVVIVKGVKDLDKVKKGNIMVAVTTHPDFVPAMRKAAAIVTDEGGITSHAAIVSREFGIPCIVGTKQATRILKDGDVVEVDANIGVVKKIN